MSETLERSAQLTKLARLLDVEPAELAFLGEVPSSALETFRAQVTERLFAGDAGLLKRVALSSKLLPVPVVAKVAQLTFGPMLCAATAGLLEPDRAARISARVPTDFLADIAVHLDPRRAAEVIAAIPVDVVVRVARELLRRDEHITVGRFVNFLPRDTLAAAVPEIDDNADLLRVAFVMEGKDHLDDVVELARDRFGALVRSAYDHGLWAEALDLMSHLDLVHLTELGDVAAEQDLEVLDSLVRAAGRLDVWEDLLAVLAAMSSAGLTRLAAVPAVVETGILRDLVDAAVSYDLWLDLLPLSTHLPEAALVEVAAAAAEQDDDVLERLLSVVDEADRWDDMLPLARALPAQALTTVVARAHELGRGDLVALLTSDVAP